MFAKIDTTHSKLLAYPCHNWTDDFKHVSFPLDLSLMSDEDLLSFSVVRVVASPKPNVTDTQFVVEAAPVLQGSVWTQKWEVHDIPAHVLQQQADTAKNLLKDQMRQAIQTQLDATALSWRYDSLLAATSYAQSTDPQFASDASQLIRWRDEMWQAWHVLELRIDSGEVLAQATVEDLLAHFPPPPTQQVLNA